MPVCQQVIYDHVCPQLFCIVCAFTQSKTLAESSPNLSTTRLAFSCWLRSSKRKVLPLKSMNFSPSALLSIISFFAFAFLRLAVLLSSGNFFFVGGLNTAFTLKPHSIFSFLKEGQYLVVSYFITILALTAHPGVPLLVPGKQQLMAAAAASTEATALPKGIQKLDDESILYIKKKALTTYNKKLKKRPQKLKYIIYGIDTSDSERFVKLWIPFLGDTCGFHFAHYYFLTRPTQATY